MSPVFVRLERSEAARNADRASAAPEMHIAALGENTQGWADHDRSLGDFHLGFRERQPLTSFRTFPGTSALTPSYWWDSMGRALVEGVKRLGCRVARDDFGWGLSSFSYLRSIPIGCLKIGGAFIRNLADNPVDQRIVRAVVEPAAGFGIETTAEFVESAEVLDLLRVFGVHYARGYYIGRPAAETCGQSMVAAALGN